MSSSARCETDEPQTNDQTAYDSKVNSKKELEEQKVRLEDLALKKESELQAKLKLVGNYVHESVPVSNDEVRRKYSLPKKSND